THPHPLYNNYTLSNNIRFLFHLSASSVSIETNPYHCFKSFVGPSVPGLGRKMKPSIGINGSGFSSIKGFPKRVVLCSSAVEGADKASPSQSRMPRLVSQGCKLVGCGSAVPQLQISNDDLAKMVDTSDKWISDRTGIHNRRVLTGKETLVSLAAESARKALEMAKVDPDELDMILLCTSTPEDLFGSAPQIQKQLGCKGHPLAYDITAACSGFIMGLISASCHIRGGGFKNVLVIGADALSRYVNWTDRGSCILFGDAAGAVLVQVIHEFPLSTKNLHLYDRSLTYEATLQACDGEDDGLFSFDLHSDGDGQSNMNGKEVYRFAVQCVPETIESSLEKAGLTAADIDWLLLHQANKRIIDSVADRLKLPSERVISNLANYGNTSAASIPLALDEAVRSGKVKPGHTIATAGFGAGLTWGSAIIRWG
ncbi:Beta-ketoacyl-[acyl-carrier-protein] synthase III A, chloroplastic, partial [Linum perenne]